MKAWMLPWLFPVGLLGIVVLFTVFKDFAVVIVGALGVVLAIVAWHPRFRPGAGEGDVNYWRFKRL